MAKCRFCRKSELICKCYSSTPPTRRKTGTVTDRNGIEWCVPCGCRVINGRCTNVTCSTRRG